MKESKQQIESYKAYLKGRDGFITNPDLCPKHNARLILGNTPTSGFHTKISNLKYHNLCTEDEVPEHIDTILGLGCSFCLQTPLPYNQDINKTMSRDLGKTPDGEHYMLNYNKTKNTILIQNCIFHQTKSLP